MLDKLKISQRLWLISILAGSLFTISVIVGWSGLRAAEQALKSVFEDRAVPMHDLARIEGHVLENYGHILRAFQHDPANPLHVIHDHPVELHLDGMEKGVSEIDRIWAKYMATYLTDEEKVMAADFMKKLAAWRVHLHAARDAIKAGDYSLEAMARFLKAGREERQAAIEALDHLMSYQESVARKEFEAAEARARTTLWLFGILVVIGIVGVIGMSHLTIRRIGENLKAAGNTVEAIAAGDLTRTVCAGHGALLHRCKSYGQVYAEPKARRRARASSRGGV